MGGPMFCVEGIAKNRVFVCQPVPIPNGMSQYLALYWEIPTYSTLMTPAC